MRQWSKLGLPLLILVTGLLYIFVIPSDPHGVKLTFKLIPMGLMLIYALLRIPRERSRVHALLAIGLLFCMAGDGLLQWFVVGLTAFLIGHLFYMAGFFTRWRYSHWRAATLAPIAVYGAVMGSYLLGAIYRDGSDSLAIPVIVYIAAISLMCWSAIMTANPWAIAGSILFVISDSILAWNKFVSDVPYSGPLIMLTYYGGQFLIATGIAAFAGGRRSSPPHRSAAAPAP